MSVQAVQAVIELQVVQAVREALQSWQLLPLMAYPELQPHLPVASPKFPATLQVTQVLLLEHWRHPTRKSPHGLQMELLSV